MARGESISGDLAGQEPNGVNKHRSERRWSV